jgi:ATP-dependent Clp protease ATP-binding subunit ClpC
MAPLAAEAIGQDGAARQVAAVLQRLRGAAAVAEPRPVSLILAGPPGTGKRAMAQALAQALYHEDSLIAFDLAEFRDTIDVEKLLGAPPGYIGHDRESLLSRRLRRDPYVVLTLEHLETACAEIQDIFLRGLSDGSINDNQGHTIHLENAVVLLLLDLEAGGEASRRPLGFVTGERVAAAPDPEQVRALVREALGQETIDAVHEVVYFPPLAAEALKALAQRGLDRLAAVSGLVVFDAGVADWLAAEALHAGTGRRALERLIRDQVGAPVHDALAAARPRPGEVLYGDVANGRLVLKSIPRPTAA